MSEPQVEFGYVLALMVFSWLVGIVFGIQFTWWSPRARAIWLGLAFAAMGVAVIVETF